MQYLRFGFSKLFSMGAGLWKSKESSTEEKPVQHRTVTPFVFTRKGSLSVDEDGHEAHEFYEEITDPVTKRSTLRQIKENLRPQGDVKLSHPRLNSRLPIVLAEVPAEGLKGKKRAAGSAVQSVSKR